MINCDFCLRSFSCKLYLHNHIVHCVKNPEYVPYKCSKCDKTFSKSHELSIHYRYCGLDPKIKSKKEKNCCHLIIRKCKYCEYKTYNPYKIGAHTSICLDNPNYYKILKSKIENGKTSVKHTEETKKKISKSRKEYLLNNPDKVPYLLNHSRNESYPEKYFGEIFEKSNLGIVKSYRIGLYELDFSIPNKRIDIEIDGEQHYCDEKIVNSDIRRNRYLEDLGWDIIRIRWSDYQKIESKSKKTKYLNGIFSYINGLIDKKPTVDDRPSLESLLKDTDELGYAGTGRKYSVSDNTIRKWIKHHRKLCILRT